MTENYLSEFEGKSYVSLDYHKKKLKEQEKFIDALKYAYHKSLKQNKELYKRIEILEGYKGKSEKTLKERLANQYETIANQLKEIEKLSSKCTNTQGDKE